MPRARCTTSRSICAFCRRWPSRRTSRRRSTTRWKAWSIRGAQGNERKSAEIVRSIVDLGRSLGLEVVAEGIETPAQAENLRELQCAFGQGFLFSRPVDEEKALQIVRAPATL